MKKRIVIIAACAGTFALAQIAMAQPADANPAGPMGEAWVDLVAPGLLTKVYGCRDGRGGYGEMMESYTNAYGRHVRRCVSRDYYRVQNSGAYTNPPPQPWRERKRW